MDHARAMEIIRSLANGVDPTTGEVFPAESVYNSPEIIRALFYALEQMNCAAANPLRNAGKPWTDIEDAKLYDEFDSKMRVSDIAKEHGRTYKAIESRLERLGLKKKPFWIFRKKNS
ncbi:MAG: hypothetical protein E7449_00555 [Ruminococcaceae bacterium]|nr:hypothetical protein [Oscillospiraceae bacterium]